MAQGVKVYALCADENGMRLGWIAPEGLTKLDPLRHSPRDVVNGFAEFDWDATAFSSKDAAFQEAVRRNVDVIGYNVYQ